jgi:SAM-dependent methyltransferase
MHILSQWGHEETETKERIVSLGFYGTILNVMAGDGRFNNDLLQLEEVEKIIAVDNDQNELDKLIANCPSELQYKLSTKVIDVLVKFPFEKNAFDGVFCTGALHLFDVQSLTQIIAQIDEVMKVGGKLLIDFATDIKRVKKD